MSGSIVFYNIDFFYIKIIDTIYVSNTTEIFIHI